MPDTPKTSVTSKQPSGGGGQRRGDVTRPGGSAGRDSGQAHRRRIPFLKREEGEAQRELKEPRLFFAPNVLLSIVVSWRRELASVRRVSRDPEWRGSVEAAKGLRMYKRNHLCALSWLWLDGE